MDYDWKEQAPRIFSIIDHLTLAEQLIVVRFMAALNPEVCHTTPFVDWAVGTQRLAAAAASVRNEQANRY